MKVLVTGASGFLGTAVVQDLHNRGFETRSLFHSSSEVNDKSLESTEIIWGDLERDDHFDYVKDCDAVVHCAWSSEHITDSERYMQANVLPAIALLRAAYRQGATRFILISSVSVYGFEPSRSGRAFCEDDPFCSYDDAMDIFPRTKQEVEKAMISVSQELGMSITIIRPGLLYSDDIPPVKKSQSGKISLFPGSGTNYLPYVHTSAVADLVGKVLEKPHDAQSIEILNAVPSHNDTARAVYKRWKRQHGSTAKSIYVPAVVYEKATLVPYLIKKLAKKDVSKPNSAYEAKSGTRNIDYSAQRALDSYGWIGY